MCSTFNDLITSKFQNGNLRSVTEVSEGEKVMIGSTPIDQSTYWGEVGRGTALQQAEEQQGNIEGEESEGRR